jgi:hypothetical protein
MGWNKTPGIFREMLIEDTLKGKKLWKNVILPP